MSHPLYGPEILGLLQDDDVEGLRAFCDTLHPATVAEALDDEFSAEQIWAVLEPSDIRQQASIFEYLPLSRQVEMVEGPVRPRAGQLIGKMSHDDRVDLLQKIPARARESLLRLVDEADRRDIATLENYEPGTVGALMTTDYAWLPPALTAAEAIDQLRQQAPDRETIYYIYVLDELGRKPEGGMTSRRLLGIISLRDLILAQRGALIRDIMEDSFVALRVGDDREVAADTLARYDFIAMPVLDKSGGLVGIVTHDDVIDVITEEATDDLQKQAGMSPLGAGYLETSFVTLWLNRSMWLCLLFVGGMLTFEAMEFFEGAMSRVRVLGLLIPMVLSTGGNSGTQAATLITRAMALGEIGLGDWFRVLRHELLMGLAMGAAVGLVGFARAFVMPSALLTTGDATITHLELGLVLLQAVAAICLTGTLIGSMLPLVFKRVGIDPALASSPFVGTAVDVTGIVIYFSIARVYLL